MNVNITFSQVPGTFAPEAEALGKLLKLVEELYGCEPKIFVKTTDSFKCNSDGQLVPLKPVEVTLVPNLALGEKLPWPPADFSIEAVRIGMKIKNLLLSSSPHSLNLPSQVKVVAWGGTAYKFKGRESIMEIE